MNKLPKNQAAFLRNLKHLRMPLIGTKPMCLVLQKIALHNAVRAIGHGRKPGGQTSHRLMVQAVHQKLRLAA